MWFKPAITLFLPQAQHTRTSFTGTVTPLSFQKGVEQLDDKENQTTCIDKFSFEDPWGGKLMVESDGNYLGETFLEKGPLYSNQDKLRSLPVPTLSETIDRFLGTATPLAESESEAKTLKDACDSFENQAKVLQERLEARSFDCQEQKTSWLQEWWQKDMYLTWRAPLNFFSSYYFLLNDPDEPPPPFWESTPDAGIVKAAALCRAAYDYADQVTSGIKAPDVAGKKQEPLCSTGYKYLFNSCRIPKQGADTYRIYNPRVHRHAIVACRGHFFEIPLENEQGKPLNHPELEDLLSQCEEKANTDDPSFLELGWLTTWGRDEWAEARELLLERGGAEMAKALSRLESALIVINLDVDTVAQTLPDQAINFYHGGLTEGMNRWWDKSIQIPVTRNGKWAYIGEHSMADGMLPVEFCQDLLENGKFDPHRRIPEDEAAPISPGPDAVDVFKKAVSGLSAKDSKDIQDRINKAKSAFLGLTHDLTITAHHESHGSDFIKKSGASSDAYAQMAIQLAAYRLFGKLVATYESTQVRPYLHGRTEATRTVSPIALAFCEAMGKELNKERSQEEREKLVKLLQQAAFSHIKYSKKATMGLGVDRHFFGLSKMIKEENETPDLFKHPLFQRSKHWRLSTSTLPTCPGFGMVVDDGLGVGYAVYKDDMVFNIAARTETGYVEKFDKLLGEAFEDMKSLIS